MRARPLGVTILALLLFLNIASYVFLIVLSIRNPEQLRSLLESIMPGAGVGPGSLMRLGAFVPVYFLGMAIVTGLVGRALWSLKNWARITVMVLAGVSTVLGIAEVVWSFSGTNPLTLAGAVARIGLSLAVAWYLNSAKVRAAFTRPAKDSMRR
jgi:hypothetical protein